MPAKTRTRRKAKAKGTTVPAPVQHEATPPAAGSISHALWQTLISPACPSTDLAPANVVDGLYAIADAIKLLAATLPPHSGQPAVLLKTPPATGGNGQVKPKLYTDDITDAEYTPETDPTLDPTYDS